ncbi:M15 family metallopeptidase [Actinoplanes solisilvae]|uniref:M15 family metallopeptidase n=1 Tax=Actinoplanes solisilvae TaxID=2486853 RepID=UPI000FD8D2E2|nr:M15 family metallopeptidase [Actinoplanes solisilvae]
MRRILPVLIVLLLLPFAAPTRAAAAGTVWHVIRPQESLAYIAGMYDLDPHDLASWNQIPYEAPIQPDGVLRLNPPPAPLPVFSSRIETVSPGMVNWNPAKGCPIIPANLRRVWVTYIDFTGAARDGSVIVRHDVAPRVQRAFETLYRWRFRIMAMAPMRLNMPGETDMSIVTAGYNCRAVAGTKVWSEHAAGTAVDINPLQNPMKRGTFLSPAAGGLYLDRNRRLIGMIHPEGAARAFLWNGFHWGGTWTSLKDYMHFSLTNR